MHCAGAFRSAWGGVRMRRDASRMHSMAAVDHSHMRHVPGDVHAMVLTPMMGEWAMGGAAVLHAGRRNRRCA